MDYVCLAAGKGTRFGALGRILQKALYPVDLTPFLELSIRNLSRSGAFDPARDRLTILVGHLGEQVRTYFGEQYGPLRIRYAEQEEQRGTGHALRVLHQTLRPRGPVVAWLADLYVPQDAFATLAALDAENVLTVAPAGDDDNLSVRVTEREGRIERCWHGAGPLADVGLWKLAPDVLEGMRETTGTEIRALPNLQRHVDAGAHVAAMRIPEWLHLGGTRPTPEENLRRVVRRIRELEES